MNIVHQERSHQKALPGFRPNTPVQPTASRARSSAFDVILCSALAAADGQLVGPQLSTSSLLASGMIWLDSSELNYHDREQHVWLSFAPTTSNALTGGCSSSAQL